jgi:hypothetical protein
MAVTLPSIESIPLQTPVADRPGVSFGGAEAANQDLGGAVTGLGVGLEKQADFIQSIRNENNARDASVALNAQMGKISSDYFKLQGKAADDGFDGFTSQLAAARESAVAAMPNLEAQKMLGDQAAYMVDRFQIEGTRYRSEAIKAWTNQSYLGKLDDAGVQATQNWDKPDFVAQQGMVARDAALSTNAINHADGPTSELNLRKAADTAYGPAIIAASASNPAAAQGLYDRFKGEMSAPLVASLAEHLKTGERNAGIAAGIAQTMATPLTSGNGLPAGSPAALDAATRARAQVVHDEVVKQGGSDDEAWGWAANAVHEGGANAAPAPGDGGISHGMFQLNKDQLAAYQSQHAGHLPEQDDVATQIQFARSQAAPSLTGARGPGGYAAAISTGFEVPANGATEAANRAATGIMLAGGPGAAAPAAGIPPGSPAHDPAPYGIEFQRMQIARTQAAQKFPNDQMAQRQWVDGVWQEIQQTNVMQAKYEAEQAKALSDARNAAGSTFLSQIEKDPKSLDLAAMQHSPLTWEQRNDLYNIAQKRLGEVAGGKETLAYGPGFWSAYQQVHSNDPTQKVTDPSQLWGRGGPTGDLSLAGIDRLTTEISGRKATESLADSDSRKQFFDAAHIAISGHGMLGGQRDAVGEMNFARFMPGAFAEWDKEHAAGMTVDQMMKPGGTLDALVQHATRTPQQRMKDMLGDNNPDLTVAAGDGAAPAKPAVDLTTAAGITSAYKSGYYGMGPDAYDKAAAELQRRGFVKAPPAVPATPTIPND